MTRTPFEVSQLIRETRKMKGLTQKELGEKMGISESSVNKYEKDNPNLTIQTLNKIADALGVNLKIIFEE